MTLFPLAAPGRRALLGLAVGALLAPALSAQYVPRDERGSLDARAQTDLDGNEVVATVFNFGLAGRPSGFGDEVPFEWPRGTGRFYLALEGLFVGAEVESVTGETTAIVDVPAFREDFGNPSSAWTWAPVPGYLGGGEIARSDRPETWPAVWPDRLGDADDPGWPGSWNGLLGKDALIDGVETYAHYADDGYDRNRQSQATTYYPDATDLDRAGLGIVVSERRLAFRDGGARDAVFTVRDLHNAGTEDLGAVAATVWVADVLGGYSDAEDDDVVLDDARDMVLFVDRDGESADPAFGGGQRVGAVALVLLETPGGLGFTNVQRPEAGSVNFQHVSDAAFFERFMEPAPPETATGPRDQDVFASVGLFPIAAGASVRLATALVFGAVDYGASDPEVRFGELIAKAEQVRQLYARGFATLNEGDERPAVRAEPARPVCRTPRPGRSASRSRSARPSRSGSRCSTRWAAASPSSPTARSPPGRTRRRGTPGPRRAGRTWSGWRRRPAPGRSRCP